MLKKTACSMGILCSLLLVVLLLMPITSFAASKNNDIGKRIIARDGSELLLIPAGEFWMGDGKLGDDTRHRVYLDTYYIGKYTVTNAQYGRFVRETGYSPPKNTIWNDPRYANHPVVNIGWDGAMAYAKWVDCDLPTEAQWEKAFRGPDNYVYPWGNEWDPSKCRHINNRENEKTAPVDAYPQGVSGYGTYQQSGNVLEWCYDWYDIDYYGSPEAARNPRGPSTGTFRVLKGGSWSDDHPIYFMATARSWNFPGFRYDNQGFRLAKMK